MVCFRLRNSFIFISGKGSGSSSCSFFNSVSVVILVVGKCCLMSEGFLVISERVFVRLFFRVCVFVVSK